MTNQTRLKKHTHGQWGHHKWKFTWQTYPRSVPKLVNKISCFTKEDSLRVQHPHDDAHVVTLVIANHWTRRVVIDNGSSTNILHPSAFEQMGIRKDNLWSTIAPLVGFIGDKLYPSEVITLLVTTGINPHQVTKAVNFLVVDYPSVYNAIIDQPTSNKMKAITWTYHLLMHFPTMEGVGEVRGTKQQLASATQRPWREKNQRRPLSLMT